MNKRFVCRDNPREIRNKAEKQRRDKLNQSIEELASMVPPVVANNRKIDKTGVLRLTAHYLRAHQYGKSLLIVSYFNIVLIMFYLCLRLHSATSKPRTNVNQNSFNGVGDAYWLRE